MDSAPHAQSLAASLNHSALNVANALGAALGAAVIAAGYGFGVLLGYLRAARHRAAHATVIVDVRLQVVGTLTDKTRWQNLVTLSVINHSFGNRVAQSDNLL